MKLQRGIHDKSPKHGGDYEEEVEVRNEIDEILGSLISSPHQKKYLGYFIQSLMEAPDYENKCIFIFQLNLLHHTMDKEEIANSVFQVKMKSIYWFSEYHYDEPTHDKQHLIFGCLIKYDEI